MVVVLPSPAGVGLIAVTRISLPSFFDFSVSRYWQRDLGLVVAVGFEVLLGDAQPLQRHLGDALQLRGLRDLDVGRHGRFS